MSSTLTTTQNEFALLLQSKLRDDSTSERLQKTLQTTLQRQDIKSQTLNEIRQLRQTVSEIEDAFQKISRDLYSFDRKRFRGEDGDVLQLCPQWTGYHTRFKQIMEQSYKNAVAASAFMEQYSRALLTDVTVEEIPDIKIELEGFVKELESKEEVALQTQNNFKTLAENIRLFSAVLEQSLQRAGAQLTSELTATRARLSELNERLDAAYSKMRGVGIACVSCLAAGAVGAGIALFTLNPYVAVAAAGAIIGGIGAGGEYLRTKEEAEKIEKDIKNCKNDLDELLDKEQLLREYQRSLGATKEEISTLADKIDVISNIWRSLKVDMQKLHEELKLVLAGTVVTRRFLKKLQVAREVYTILAQLLEEYARGQPA